MATPNVPLDSVPGIEALIAFGLQIVVSIFSLFQHPTTPIPVAAAPVLTAQLQATPGLTDAHKTVIANAVDAAVKMHTVTA
jgi:hypothetical protein